MKEQTTAIRHARIPLVPVAELPPYMQRLTEIFGTVPASMQAYAHRPEIAAAFLALENAVLSGGAVELPIKAGVAYVVSRDNGCDYCAAHVGGLMKGAGISDEQLACMISPTPQTGNPTLDSALAYARLAARRAATDSSLADLSKHFSTEQIVELTCVVGLFSWTNHVHDALGIPIEDRFEKLGAHRIRPAQETS